MEELKAFRINMNMSPQDFATSIGVSLSLYQKVEAGFRKPSRDFTEKLKKKYPQFDVNIFFAESIHKTWVTNLEQ